MKLFYLQNAEKLVEHDFNQHLITLVTPYQIQRGVHQHRQELSTGTRRYWRNNFGQKSVQDSFTHSDKLQSLTRTSVCISGFTLPSEVQM